MRTKIICTIGPNSESEAKIRQLILNGMDIARLNFSHDTQERHSQRIDRIRKWANKLGKYVEILCDLQGPKIRLADFDNFPKKIKDGDRLTLVSSAAIKTKNILMITDPYVHSDVKTKDIILIDDGAIELMVEKTIDHQIICKVIRGGLIYPKKGVNLPLTKTTTSSLTNKDIKDMEFILTKNPDWVAISFVQSEEDVVRLKSLIGKNPAKIMCKIETAKALENLDAIIRSADGVMVARGDLGVEMPMEKVPLIQKQIIKRCNYENKPVVIATHMLSSMVDSPIPTRAEVSDIANAIFDGADAVMLSNETTVGKHPAEALKVMKKVVQSTENYLFNRPNKL